jgi:hypothetical protein
MCLSFLASTPSCESFIMLCHQRIEELCSSCAQGCVQQARDLQQRRVSEIKDAVAKARTALSDLQQHRRQLRAWDYTVATALLHARAASETRIASAPGARADRVLLSQPGSATLQPAHMMAQSDAARAVVRLPRMRQAPVGVSASAKHAAFTFQDVSDVAGGLTMADMLPNIGMHVRACHAALAARLGCHAADVCWYLGLGLEVAQGVQLSICCQLDSAECLNSLLLFWLLSILQFAFLVDEAGSLRHAQSDGESPCYDYVLALAWRWTAVASDGFYLCCSQLLSASGVNRDLS